MAINLCFVMTDIHDKIHSYLRKVSFFLFFFFFTINVFILQQENCKNDEILRSLKYVRPGGGFEPRFPLLEKVDVNGKDAHPLFEYLKEKLPFPSDNAMALMTDPKFILWSPVRRNDVSWNFEKFLVSPEGEPYKRYSRSFLTAHIEADIKELLTLSNNNK